MAFNFFSNERRDTVIVAFIAIFFLISSLTLALGARNLFNSPDELANHFFATEFASTGRLFVFEPLNIDLGDALHPRSMVSASGRIMPISFLGMPVIYGILA